MIEDIKIFGVDMHKLPRKVCQELKIWINSLIPNIKRWVVDALKTFDAVIQASNQRNIAQRSFQIKWFFFFSENTSM